ncbi:MAG: UDP-glucose--hexose-phosphateuridylyl transferase [Firmicutes bacterium]|nr:UDP-glucose--hexose-phosphateuridylyl transferase [Bacillota bacterium]
MSELRRDLVKNNWVSVAEHRALKPNDFPIAKKALESSVMGAFCPFCEGNEQFTPPEIAAYREDSEPNTKGWLVRAIPNKFSAFELEGELEETCLGVFSRYNGLGKHEVIIEAPEHDIDFHQLSVERMEIILKIMRDRYNDLACDKRIKYIQIYKNRGIFAGASLEHSHSQIVALPLVPAENQGMIDYYKEKHHCLLCDILAQEMSDERLVAESEAFILLCPYAPRFPYETWIIPKNHKEHFGGISAAEIQDLAKIIKKFSNVMIESLADPSYNLVINTAPVNVDYQPGYHWYIELTPRLLVNAAVEIASGIYINPVAPELAAAMLREKMLTAK